MDPAIVLFGFCIGVLVGMTGMGGGSLMTPLLILIFDTSPTTAIGTDIVYSAVTKMVGSWRHLKMGTVNLELVKWLSFGSVPAAVAGVVARLGARAAHLRGPAELAGLRGARRHPADGRRGDAGPGADPARADRRARALRGRETPQGRRGRDRRHHRLRHRDHLGGLRHGDRDPPDRRLPAGAEAGRRHRHRPRRDPPDRRRARPHRRRQRRLRPRREHPRRLDPRRDHRRGALRQGPAGLHPHRPRHRPDGLRHRHDPEGRFDRLADRGGGRGRPPGRRPLRPALHEQALPARAERAAAAAGQASQPAA